MEAQTNINISDINPNNQHIALNEHNTLSNPYTVGCTN